MEMQVLGILEAAPDRAVSDVQAELQRRGQALAYTTVMTVVSRLHEKGFLKRRKDGRQFLYAVVAGKQSPRQRVFRKVRETLFFRERLQPILALLDDSQELTDEELKELRRAVDERLKGK